MLTLSETVLNAVLFTALTQSYSGTTCEVGLCTNLLFLVTVVFGNDGKKNVHFQVCLRSNTYPSVS
jgi:hypothetical protein